MMVVSECGRAAADFYSGGMSASATCKARIARSPQEHQHMRILSAVPHQEFGIT